MEFVALIIAGLIGWGISRGLKEHMEPEPGLKPIAGEPTTTPLPPLPETLSCEDYFAKLPTGSSDIDNLRNAVTKMYKVASSKEDADTLDSTAAGLDSIGHHEAATCLRTRAAEIRSAASSSDGGAMLFPTDSTTSDAAPAPSATAEPSASPSGFVFPTG